MEIVAETEKEIRVMKAILVGSHCLIRELPVKSTSGVTLLDLDSWESHICYQTLRHWRHAGYVILYEKEGLIGAIVEAYRDMTSERAKDLVESLIKKEIFREEEGWIIPLKALLKCATPNLAKGSDWCFTYTYYDVDIALISS